MISKFKQKNLSKFESGVLTGEQLPNKKYYDPRKWAREGELTFKERLKRSFNDLNNIND